MSRKTGTWPIKLNDPNFHEKVQAVLDEIGSDVSDIDCSDQEDGECILSNHDTNSCVSCDSEDGGENNSSMVDTTEDSESDDAGRQKNYYGRNRFKWSVVEPSRNVRTPAHNKLKIPSLRADLRGKTCMEPIDVWSLIFSDEMVNNVVRWTNTKIDVVRQRYADPAKSDLRPCTVNEMKSFLGLLIYSAIFKSNNEDICSLFATDGTGRDIFRTTMSRARFAIILICLRFDDPNDRDVRAATDPAAAISEMLQNFVENSQNCYSLGANATVDEMLISFRGRCKFKMYIPSKPAKYGLKAQILADSKTYFVYNMYLYCGKGTDGLTLTPEEQKLSIPTQAVVRLCKPIVKSNRNITCDNWYTSIELADELKKRGLTLVGTIRKNRKEIPNEFLPSNKRTCGSNLYGFTKNTTLISHVPKKRKAVLLISTMHHSGEIDPETNKPEIIAYYNKTKGGVDTVDEKCSKYCSSRRTRRWPMVVFFRLLDMSALNAFVVYQSLQDSKPITRMIFLKTLAKQLTQPALQERLVNTRLPRELRMSVARVLGTDMKQDEEAQHEEKLPRDQRKTCYLCPAKKKRKTAYLCCNCKSPICLECSKKMCSECVNHLLK